MAKKGFLDGYEMYDTSQGFGSAREWRSEFNKRMSKEEAEVILDNDDPYYILGLRRPSTKAEIKSAYKRLAMKWHPDRNPEDALNATKMMQKINAAYAYLIG